jgi:uncharacterized protein YggU (UPF0235/DUF167 family)
MAKALDVPKSRIRLIGGDTARQKTLDIEGLDAEQLERWSKSE